MRNGGKADNAKLFFGDEKKRSGPPLRGRLSPLSVQLKTRRYRNRGWFYLRGMFIMDGPIWATEPV
ncbi:hypothetical protein DOQ87_06680 [Salmonella enterica subsp. enterica serovar Benin]|nr:hypothetical protein [Salmonella enterica subsp. enterica serovar Benin]EBW4215969.1 hypothetical protein [Salmonella enterica subsp. enterica serovar Benin]ECB2068742.1 hypothetical protein [Salmonella enterica subsp. enterica serovar Benin]ECE9224823.1 hypothetical protein [Salmonella enterica subsp. enterica serovar Benin]